MESIQGIVEHIVYHNEENFYTVLYLRCRTDEVACTGYLSLINEGEYIKATGEYVDHPTYGKQFKIQGFEILAPEDEYSMERYLGSGAIKGVGPALAAKIVDRFGEDTFRIIEDEPERLSEVKGISDRIARQIYAQFYEKQEMRNAMMFLSKYGISNSYAVKIFDKYGEKLYTIIRENPYKLADDIQGIGFKLADDIARNAGIAMNSEYRIKSGIIYVLLNATYEGHTFLPLPKLLLSAAEILELKPEEVEAQIVDLVIDRKVIVKDIEDVKAIYLTSFYFNELNTANLLKRLDIKSEVNERKLYKEIDRIEKDEGITLDEVQRDAVRAAAENGVLVVTGGPGTGKTTTINAIIRYFYAEGQTVLLGAPTGRAAKRMTQATGFEASTIHRMLELMGSADSESEADGGRFDRNEYNPLEADVIIIDEMSMVDINLMTALMKAIAPGTKLIMVGDEDQLPSVGPGNVLQDIIKSEVFKVVKLTKIFRQALTSRIVKNAHLINEGQEIDLTNNTKDFFIMKRYNADDIIGIIVALIRDKLPPNVGTTSGEIQVLTAMRKGELGVIRLNEVLQHYLNPKDENKRECPKGDGILREGDKVMQIKNNYHLEWEITGMYNIVTEKGTGVFNGDMGYVKEINNFSHEVTVEFDDEKKIVYPFSQLDELELAYAVTVHKSQGSEYPAVIMPILTMPRMLFNRNILYTAVTRAKKCVALVGSEESVQQMIGMKKEFERYSSLDIRLCED